MFLGAFVAVLLFTVVATELRSRRRERGESEMREGQTSAQVSEEGANATQAKSQMPENGVNAAQPQSQVSEEGKNAAQATSEAGAQGASCSACELLSVCEKPEKNTAEAHAEEVYFDDEELDAYRLRPASDYRAEEVEEFREVLLTLRREEVSQWVESLHLRQINLPEELAAEAVSLATSADNTTETPSQLRG